MVLCDYSLRWGEILYLKIYIYIYIYQKHNEEQNASIKGKLDLKGIFHLMPKLFLILTCQTNGNLMHPEVCGRCRCHLWGACNTLPTSKHTLLSCYWKTCLVLFLLVRHVSLMVVGLLPISLFFLLFSLLL